jgi:hypothetical protein
MAEAANETVVPFGLIESNWGGTMVEMWQPNSTLNAHVCKNASGGTYEASQLNRWDIDAGALYNGMVRFVFAHPHASLMPPAHCASDMLI